MMRSHFAVMAMLLGATNPPSAKPAAQQKALHEGNGDFQRRTVMNCQVGVWILWTLAMFL